MNKENKAIVQFAERRNRIHELVIALIHQQKDFDLLDAEAPRLDPHRSTSQELDPARWLDRNRRVLKKYQALVKTATTIDALVEAEQGENR